MARHLGYTTADGVLGHVEHDCFTCGHCQRIVTVEHRCAPEDAGGLCKMCMALICSSCFAANRCTPWEKQMEQMEARARARRSYGLGG